MKIGIITSDGWLRQWDNYGTLFQNYALQSYLRKAGHETFLIQTGHSDGKRFTGKRVSRLCKRILRNPRGIFSFLKGTFYAQTVWRMERRKILEFNRNHPRHFSEFFEKYIPKTSGRFSEDDLLSAPPRADAYIVGSDQVWGGVSPATFLGFGSAEALRISYAASTAWKTRSRKWFEKAAKKLPNFDAVSVREPEGVGVCAQAGRADVKHVCDPTLLLEREDYLNLVCEEKADTSLSRKTVLAYFLNVKKLEQLPWEEVVSFAKERDADLRVVPLQGTELAIPEKFVFTPSPAEWLNVYDKAECILTNSFHGTAFAIIMRKPFLVVLQKGKTEAENCRFLSILEKLGLTSRILRIGGGISAQMDAPIDWKDVESKLNAFRAESMQFLAEALGIRKTP